MPRFVVLEHEWNGLHWDLMFEFQGVLRTWATDDPLTIGNRVQARQLTDHRMIYLDYEGPISGGRGRVRRIDQGSYEAEHWDEHLVTLRLQGHQLDGVLELRRSDVGAESRSAERWTLLFLGKLA